jgi:hypothetical protein
MRLRNVNPALYTGEDDQNLEISESKKQGIDEDVQNRLNRVGATDLTGKDW